MTSETPNGNRLLSAAHNGRVGAYADYQAYLLRLWQETPQSAWRFWLQDVSTGMGQVFGDLESLGQFLQARVTGGERADR